VQLFWPDDNAWYLVEIAGVNLKNKCAKIVYSTGELGASMGRARTGAGACQATQAALAPV
jgi:hypothetical protein